MKQSKGKSLCVFSSKGGVGKTTTALNLAGFFSRLEKKTLIIDADMSSGAVAAMLNTEFNKTIYNFVDDFANNRYTDLTNYVTKYNEYIYFMASPKDPRQASKINPNFLDIILEKAVLEFDIVIVDTNHVLNEFNITLLDKCDETILCISNDLVDMKNTRNLIKIFKDIDKTNYKVLLNLSINPGKKYYSLYDIKSVINSNIDYIIDSNFYIRSYDTYVSDGKILSLEKKMPKAYPKVNKAFLSICNFMLEEDFNDK